MKTPALVAIVTILHIVAVGAFFFIQGCGTQHPSTEPPPAPVLPPTEPPVAAPHVGSAPPIFQAPLPIEPEPAVMQLEPGDTYVIQKGDSLSKIASRYGVKTRELAELNNIKDANKIRVGQKLLIPSHATRSGSSAPAQPRQASSSAAPGSAYVVQKGDSLSKIAVNHGVTIKELKAANNLTSDRILIGQKLSIPGRGAAPAAMSRPAPAPMSKPTPAPAPMPIVVPAPVRTPAEPVPMVKPQPAPEPAVSSDQEFVYIMAEGDTLDSVARDFVVLKEDLMEANDISDPNSVGPGTRLIIPIVSPSEY